MYYLSSNTTVTINYTSPYGYGIRESWDFVTPVDHSLRLSFVGSTASYTVAHLDISVTLPHSLTTVQIASYPLDDLPEELLIRSDQVLLKYIAYHAYDDSIIIEATAVPGMHCNI